MGKIIISLGGSLIVPDKIDVNFLKEFRDLIIRHIKSGRKFIIICGGGKTSRDYQNSASRIIDITKDDLDWIGIHSTRLNAHLIRTIFRREAHAVVIKNPNRTINTKKPLIVASGWRPGCSTDYDAVLLAKNYNAKYIINLTNTDYVYDKDPNKDTDAKPLKEISWKAFRKIVGDEWNPGVNVPFDPIASKEAEKLGLTVIIMSGKSIENIDNFLNHKGFKGTIIK